MLPLKNEAAKLFYAQMAADQLLGVRELRRQIAGKAFERTAIANLQKYIHQTFTGRIFQSGPPFITCKPFVKKTDYIYLMISPQKKARFLERSLKRRNQPTTQVFLRAVATQAFRDAAAQQMAVMGYNVIAQDGWVVKRYSDGRVEKIKAIKPVNRNRTIVLR